MSNHKLCRLLLVFIVLAILSLSGGALAWAIDPRFALDPKNLDQRAEKPNATPGDAPAGKPARATGKGHESSVSGTRKPETAKAAGQTRTHRRVAKEQGVSQRFRMLTSTAPEEVSTLQVVKQFWPDMVPAQGLNAPNVEVSGQNYSLSLDTRRYPTLAAADGGKIIVDAKGSLPPLVKSLLLGEGDKVRIVSEDPSNRRRFFKALLAASRFFSVEENFTVGFGTDPRLLVTTDYKIEKSDDSLLKRELTMLNVQDGKRPMPPALINFLAKEGFQVMEPFADQQLRPVKRGLLYQISSKEPKGIADSFLDALALPFDRDRQVELFNIKESGLALTIKADRYFERGGERFVVSFFAGDPVSYTLTRLLETRGYRVITLENKDDLARVSDKFLARLRLAGRYTKQPLWESGENPYSVQMSGIMLRQEGTGKKIFLTNRDLDQLTRELADANGYQVLSN